MPLGVALLLGLLSSLGWLWLLHRRDDHEREPMLLTGFAFALGIVAALGVLLLRPLLENALGPTSPLVDAFLLTAGGEEALKLCALLPLVLHRECDEPMDGVVYGAAVGLGFACLENALFGLWTEDVRVVLQRTFTSTLAHACCSGGVGFCLALARLRARGALGIALAAAGAGLAVLLHGLYDLFLDGDRRRALVALLGVLPTALVLFALKIRWARARSRCFHPPGDPGADAQAAAGR